MLCSSVQQSNSVIHVFFLILFHYGLSQNIEYNSLCCIVKILLFILKSWSTQQEHGISNILFWEIHWDGQKVPLGFSIRWYGKAQTNFLSNPILDSYILRAFRTQINHLFKKKKVKTLSPQKGKWWPGVAQDWIRVWTLVLGGPFHCI